MPIQIPLGAEAEYIGVIDLIEQKAITYSGDRDEPPTIGPIPEDQHPQRLSSAAMAGAIIFCVASTERFEEGQDSRQHQRPASSDPA